MAAQEEVIANLVAQLTAEVSNFKKGMEEAQKEAKKTADEVEKQTKRIEGFADKLKEIGAAVVEVLAFHKLKEFLEESFHKFAEAERGELRLKAAMEANGREVESLTESYKDFATRMQEVTVLDDDTVLSLLRVAETYDLTGEKAKKAAKDAIALAAVNDSSAESMIRMTAAMASGNVEQAQQFARMVPQLRGIKDQAEFVSRYNKLIESGFKAAEAEARSASGVIKQLTNDYDNLKEEIGGVIAEAVRPLVADLKTLVKWFADLTPETKRFIVVTLLATTAIIAFWLAVNAGMAVFNLLSGGVLVVIGLIVAGAVGLAVWAGKFDDLGEVIRDVKNRAQEFWDEFGDDLKAVGSLIKTVFINNLETTISVIKFLIGWVKVMMEFWTEVATRAFRLIGLEGEGSWKLIRETIRGVVYFAEFAILNLGRIITLTWKYIELGFIQFRDTVDHFFRNTLPGFLQWLGNTWVAVFIAIYNISRKVIEGLVNAVKQGITDIRKIVSGELSIADIFGKEMDKVKEEALKEFGNIPPPKFDPREISDQEQGMLNAIRKLEHDLEGDWNKFFQEKMAKEPAAAAGDAFGGLFARIVRMIQPAKQEIHELTGEIQKFDAALVGSAEAKQRLQAFHDAVTGMRKAGGVPEGPAGREFLRGPPIEVGRSVPFSPDWYFNMAFPHPQTAPQPRPVPVIIKQEGPEAQEEKKAMELQEKQTNLLQKLVDKPTVEIQVANLEG